MKAKILTHAKKRGKVGPHSFYIKRNRDKAIYWIKKAERDGSKEAAFILSCGPNNGLSIRPNPYGAVSFFSDSPYSTVGKCYLIKYAKVVQILGRNKALLDSNGSYFISTFGNGEAPGKDSVLSGVVKGKSVYKYKDLAGEVKIVPYVKYLSHLYDIASPNSIAGMENGVIDEQDQILQMIAGVARRDK